MGREMMVLHDNGRKLFTSPHDCTPMARFVYIMAKNEHEEDPTEGSPNPSGMRKGSRFQGQPF